MRGSNGKVYYYGKSTALGLKSIGKTPTLKITELIISKVSNIVHAAVGHDGIHAILVNEDGTVYFTGKCLHSCSSYGPTTAVKVFRSFLVG